MKFKIFKSNNVYKYTGENICTKDGIYTKIIGDLYLRIYHFDKYNY